ncbi:MAG: hypothetical protein ACI4RD_05795 [Kiritimatiellia bacterium]
MFQSKTRPLDSITALVGIKDQNGGISSVVPIDYTARKENGQTTIRISSIYGRLSRDSVQSWIDNGYLLYADRKNISRSFPHGLQLPGRTKTAKRFLDENDFPQELLGNVAQSAGESNRENGRFQTAPNPQDLAFDPYNPSLKAMSEFRIPPSLTPTVE